MRRLALEASNAAYIDSMGNALSARPTACKAMERVDAVEPLQVPASVNETTADWLLSTPLLLIALIAKYHVPGVRLSIT